MPIEKTMASVRAAGARYVVARGDPPLKTRRRRTGAWFAFYTILLLGIAGVSIATSQWSVALTTAAIACIAGFLALRFLRRR
jgi:hypothetical protein